MPRDATIHKPVRDTYRSRRALQIALEVHSRWPTYVPRAETVRLLAPDGIEITTFRNARNLVKSGRRDLIDRVLAGEISLHRATEIITKGDRVTCPTCSGKGHIFNQDARKNKNHEGSKG